MKDPSWWQLLIMVGLGVTMYVVLSIGQRRLTRSIQMMIIMAVALSETYYSWIGSPYLTALYGFVAAWLLTVFPPVIWRLPIIVALRNRFLRVKPPSP